MKRGV